MTKPASGGSSRTAGASGFLEVRGARENNLKDVSVELPKRRLTVFTGVSNFAASCSRLQPL